MESRPSSYQDDSTEVHSKWFSKKKGNSVEETKYYWTIWLNTIGFLLSFVNVNARITINVQSLNI